jgi:hypothetical protein
MRALLAALALLLAGCAGPTVLPSVPLGQALGSIELRPEAPVAIADHEYRDREADAAIDPRDPLHVAVFYNERPEPYRTGAIVTDPITPGLINQALATSRDGGATWTRAELPTTGKAPPGSAWNLYCAMGDPNVVFDRDSVVHVVTLFIACGGPLLGSANGILHATTADDGATWSEPDVAWVSAGGLAVSFHDREWTAYDAASGTLGIAWTFLAALGSEAQLSAIFSTDGGRTWSLPETLARAGPPGGSQSHLVHATWARDGKFHVTALGCNAGTALANVVGACLTHYRGAPGGPWASSDLSLGQCGVAGAFDYATSAADLARGTLYAGAPILEQGQPRGLCVFASFDDGATWPVAQGFPQADHPWLALAPDGSPLLAYLALNGTRATPTLAALDNSTLQVRTSVALGPSYEADTDRDGLLEYGDYDALAASEGRFVWALTQPNQLGRKAGDPWNDLDVWGYRGTLS